MKPALVVFDLDGTLTETKTPLAADVSGALADLLKKKKVAIIGGGSWEQFKKQFVSRLHCSRKLLSNLFLFPTTATSFYRYRGGWKKVYAKELPKKEREQIKKGFRDVLKEIHYIPPEKTYGKIIEDRKSQVTFSALGQDVVARLGEKGVRLKEAWTKKNGALKLTITKLMQKRLPNLEVHAAGFTSIDVTEKGIDKAYGIRQIERHLHIPVKEMIFIGDAIFPGGNDYAVKKTGVKTVKVSGPKETKKIIEWILEGS
jgi:HAD superfamily hydrolase (TIGR01484 family)